MRTVSAHNLSIGNQFVLDVTLPQTDQTTFLVTGIGWGIEGKLTDTMEVVCGELSIILPGSKLVGLLESAYVHIPAAQLQPGDRVLCNFVGGTLEVIAIDEELGKTSPGWIFAKLREDGKYLTFHDDTLVTVIRSTAQGKGE